MILYQIAVSVFEITWDSFKIRDEGNVKEVPQESPVNQWVSIKIPSQNLKYWITYQPESK